MTYEMPPGRRNHLGLLCFGLLDPVLAYCADPTTQSGLDLCGSAALGDGDHNNLFRVTTGSECGLRDAFSYFFPVPSNVFHEILERNF